MLWNAVTGDVLRVFWGRLAVPECHVCAEQPADYLRAQHRLSARVGSGAIHAHLAGSDIQDQSMPVEGMDNTLYSDGELLALDTSGQQALTTGEDDHAVLLWDVGSGEIVRRFAGLDARVSAIAFSPDGKFVLGGGVGWRADPVGPRDRRHRAPLRGPYGGCAGCGLQP